MEQGLRDPIYRAARPLEFLKWMAASAGLGLEDKERDPLNLEPGQPPDGLDNLDAPPLNLRFGKDLRLVEVGPHVCLGKRSDDHSCSAGGLLP